MQSFAAMLLAVMVGISALFSGPVELKGADMAVETPDGWLVLTRSAAQTESSAAMFGMTAEEAVRFMEDNDFYLVLYEPLTGAEIYVTIFGSQYAAQLHSFDVLTDDEMTLAKEDVQGQLTGWVFDSDVTEEKLGNFTYLSALMHSVNSEKQLDSRQLFTIYDGLEIYIDLYAGDNGLQQEHVEAQNLVAQTLQTDYAMHKAVRAYQWYVAWQVGLLLTIFVQFVGVAMTVLLHSRMKAGYA